MANDLLSAQIMCELFSLLLLLFLLTAYFLINMSKAMYSTIICKYALSIVKSVIICRNRVCNDSIRELEGVQRTLYIYLNGHCRTFVSLKNSKNETFCFTIN